MAKIKAISVAPGGSSLMPKFARRPGITSNTRMPALKTPAANAMNVKTPKVSLGKIQSPKTPGMKKVKIY